MIKYIITFLIYSHLAYSTQPSVEGLFRGSYNPDIDGDFISLRLMVELEPEEVTLEVAEEDKEKESRIAYYKLIFSLGDDDLIKLLQIKYNGSSMKDAEIEDIYFSDNLPASVEAGTKDLKSFVYGIIGSFALNDSKMMTTFLKRKIPEFELNSEMLSEEKIELLKKYKDYLEAKKLAKDNDDISEDVVLESPLKSEDQEVQENINLLLAQRFYKKSNNVELVKDKYNFYWEVKYSSMNALFSNKSHKLLSLNIEDSIAKLDLKVGEYLLFDGRHELPKLFYLGTKTKKYKITTMNYNQFKNKGSSIEDRYKEYLERLKKISGPTSEKPTDQTAEAKEVQEFPFFKSL